MRVAAKVFHHGQAQVDDNKQHNDEQLDRGVRCNTRHRESGRYSDGYFIFLGHHFFQTFFATE